MSTVQQNQQPQNNITTTIEKVVPKFCTSVSVTVIQKNIVMTLAYNEENGSSATLIERVVIDLDHAKALNEILSKVTREIESKK